MGERIDVFRIAQENRSLPVPAGSHIVSPRYLPKGHPMLDKWREWCKTTPKSQWPQWLIRDMALLRKPGAKAVKTLGPA